MLMMSPSAVPWKADSYCSFVPMKEPRVYQAEAVIIRRIKLGEADRILTIFTRDRGKISVIAKGSRRPQSKLGGHVELLTHSQLLLARGRNLDIITQAQTINSFMPLKEDLRRMSCGLYLSELVDAFTEEHVEDRQLFEMLVHAMNELCEAKNNETLLRYFELRLLDHTGYRPQFDKCANCNQPIQPVTNFFTASQGGVLCVDCGYEEPVAHNLSLNALKVLRLWQGCDYATAKRVRLTVELASELEHLMRDYIRHILERRVKSTEWLDTVRMIVPVSTD
jgi:DNA repair protein RecO (recombination protein O)